MKKKVLKRVALALSCVCAAPVGAAEWQLFATANTDTAYYFFDRETVSKQGSTVTLWVKYVKNLSLPVANGIYASTGKEVFNCAERTFKTMSISYYGKDQQFTHSYTTPSPVIDAVPGSIYALILKVVCTSDFPRNKSGDLYVPAHSNDPFLATANIFEYLRAQKADSAPQ